MRILIVGGPKTGKTTLAETMRAPARHTDDLIDQAAWAEVPDIVCAWMANDGPWVIEGVQTARALRRWLRDRPDEPLPVDRVIVLDSPHVELTGRQEGMRKAVMNIFAEVEPLLPKGVVERR